MRFLFPVLCRKQTDVLNRRDMGDAMYKYMNKFFCMIAAAITSYAVNMVYVLDNALGITVTCPSVRTTSVSYNTATCKSGSWWRPDLPYGKCGTGAEWENHCASYGRAGWSCTGSVYSMEPATGWCTCSSTYIGYTTPNAIPVTGACGTQYWCGSGSTGTVKTVECNTGPFSAGYQAASGGLRRTLYCACCPKSPVDGEIGQGSYMVYANYDATSSAGCYVVGEFSDDTGLFEYTDDNRCYYAS